MFGWLDRLLLRESPARLAGARGGRVRLGLRRCAMAAPVAASLALPQSALAAPAAPLAYTIAQPDGSTFTAVSRGDEWSNRVETTQGFTVGKDSAGVWRYVEEYVDEEPVLGNAPADGAAPAGLQKGLKPLFGGQQSPFQASAVDFQMAAPSGGFTGPVLFILAKFTDVAPSTTEAQWGTFVSSGIADYYNKTSHGRVTLTPASESSGAANNGVVGWVSLNYAHPNTGSNTGTANQQLTKDAILAADPYVNFAAYDKNNDGYVDSQELAVVVVAAGYERSYSSVYTPSVWGHKWSIGSAPVVDGKTVGAYHGGAGGYAQFGELHRASATDQHQATMGIMVHELGHLIFGLPDLYDTDNSSSGIGNFCLMSGGSWGKASTDSWLGQSPVLASAWVRYNRAWDDDKEAGGTVSITAAGDPTATAANTLFRTSSGLSSEYFLVENRQCVGYDRGLQGLIGSFGGLAIWHVDSAQSDNTNDARRLDDLEEADGTQMGTGRGQPSDLWSAVNGGAFTDASNPNSKLNSGAASGVAISSISASGTVMTASFGNAAAKPDCTVTAIALSPTAPTAGAIFSAAVTVKNGGAGAGNCGLLDLWVDQSASVQCAAAGNQRASIGTLAAGASTTVSLSGLSAGAAGTKTLRAFVDSACQTDEDNETNNQTTQSYTVANPVAQPDFVVTSIVVNPAQPTANGTFTATVTVKNQGTAAASGGWLDVWANQATAPTCGTAGNAFVSIGTLGAGASATYTLSGLPAGAAGVKTVRAFADSFCGTVESNEVNNQATVSYTVKALMPDLLVTSIVVNPTQPAANGTFTATVAVKNQGTATFGGGWLDVWTNQAAAPACNTDGNAWQWIGSLAAGASATYTFTGLPAGAAGAKTFRAFADSFCQTAESNEANNQTAQSHTVK